MLRVHARNKLNKKPEFYSSYYMLSSVSSSQENGYTNNNNNVLYKNDTLHNKRSPYINFILCDPLHGTGNSHESLSLNLL